MARLEDEGAARRSVRGLRPARADLPPSGVREGYKAQRKGMPEELAMQPVMKEVLDAMNIPRYELAGYEADDLIGTISRKCEAALWDCVVATGDKDSLQLITEHTTVKLISTRMGQTTTKRMTPESFAEEYGFEPIHIIDLKALMGDASDNIPGVPGIGEKTAMALVQKYRSIDEIYRLLPELDAKPGVIKKLTEGEESARQSYHLATILTDVPLEFAPQDNLRKAPSDALYPLLMRLEFHKLIERMGLKPAGAAQRRRNGRMHRDRRGRDEHGKGGRMSCTRLRAADHVTVLALPDLSGVIVEGEERKGDAERGVFFDRYSGDWNALLRVLFSADIKKVSHNVKDLMHAAGKRFTLPRASCSTPRLPPISSTRRRAGMTSPRSLPSTFHTQLAAPAHLEPGAFDLLGDVRAAETAFHIYTLPSGALYIGACAAHRGEAAPCALLRGRVTALPRARGDGACGRARGREGARGLRRGDGRGAEKRWRSGRPELQHQLPKQPRQVLTVRSRRKKTKNRLSTNARMCEKAALGAPHRRRRAAVPPVRQLKSTYCDGLLKVIGPDGAYPHDLPEHGHGHGPPQLSSEPNLQNIPCARRSAASCGGCSCPARQCTVDADYSQIELRLLAHIAGDETMRRAFLSGEGYSHRHRLAGVRRADGGSDEADALAREGGQLRHRLRYSARFRSRRHRRERLRGEEYIQNYLDRFSGVRRYMTEIVEKAKAQGYVETLMHRRRDLPS